MTKVEAIRKAVDDAKESGKRQGLWLLGPGRYGAEEYLPNDENFYTGFLGVVWPDGGIDYIQTNQE